MCVCAHKLYVELVHKEKLLFPCWKLVWEILYSHANPRLILSKGLAKQMEIFVYHAVIQMSHYVFIEMILTMGFSIPMKFPY